MLKPKSRKESFVSPKGWRTEWSTAGKCWWAELEDGSEPPIREYIDQYNASKIPETVLKLQAWNKLVYRIKNPPEKGHFEKRLLGGFFDMNIDALCAYDNKARRKLHPRIVRLGLSQGIDRVTGYFSSELPERQTAKPVKVISRQTRRKK